MSEKAFEPSKQLTFNTVESDRKRLLQHVRSPDTRSLRLDLSQVKQCDSAGLALLIETKRLCRDYNKSFEMQGMPSVIHDWAEFCGVDDIL